MTQRLPAWDLPVLRSVESVIPATTLVATDPDAIARVARWMAPEPFSPPVGGPEGPFDWGSEPDGVIDAVMLKAILDFAFTDFTTGVKFTTVHEGATWSDSEAMYACLHRAWRAGTPVLDGAWLAEADAGELDRIFAGNITMPMLPERAAILNEAGRVLVERHRSRFSHFVRSCAPAMYAGGDGLLERLITEFPRFDDRSPHPGGEVVIHKLAQLAVWSLHLTVGPGEGVVVGDLAGMTAFADYVVPMALELMGILRYHPDLAASISRGEEIRRDSVAEVEIRAHTVYATALLTEAINELRADPLIIPQVDFRLWSVYHAADRPHHLTRTVMY